jgi:hypothetical protein
MGEIAPFLGFKPIKRVRYGQTHEVCPAIAEGLGLLENQ